MPIERIETRIAYLFLLNNLALSHSIQRLRDSRFNKQFGMIIKVLPTVSSQFLGRLESRYRSPSIVGRIATRNRAKTGRRS